MKKELQISQEDVALIMGDDYHFLDKCIRNCFCSTCLDRVTTITRYTIYLTSSKDILLRGECFRCARPVARLIETGENPSSAAVATHIETVIKKYRTL